jgi:hypothetical protein
MDGVMFDFVVAWLASSLVSGGAHDPSSACPIQEPAHRYRLKK